MKNIDDVRFSHLRDWKKSQKLLTTYLPVLERAITEPVHPRYRVCVESGRTSCSGPNIQNLPRSGGIREAFEARPGRVLVAADYSVAELVCLAQVLYGLFGSNPLMDALKSGRDLHILTAANMSGLSYEDALHRYESGDAQMKNSRQLAKALSFGIPGGLGKTALPRYLKNFGIVVTEERAAFLRQQWLDSYPQVRLLFRHLSNKPKEFRLTHPDTGFKRGGLRFTSGANHYFQHLGAFAGKEACYLVQRACFDPNNPLYGARLIAFVHDELIISCAETRIDHCAIELERLMIEGFSRGCPDVPVQVESVAMRRWYKDAKRVVDRRGSLQVWRPSNLF